MWIKLDDGFATHPKLLKAGPYATVLQIRAICYASQNKTDGFLPYQVLPMLLIGLDTSSEVMIENNLWEPCDEGFTIHDYLEWNLSKHEQESFIKKKSQAGKKGMKARWHKKLDVVTDVISPVITPAITKPYHPTSTSTATSSSLNSLSEFEQFWSAYPKKVGGKKNVRKAWEKAKDRPPLPDILLAIERAKVSDQWTKENGDYIPFPSTWLNQGRWADEPMKGLSNGYTKIPPFPGPDDPIGRGQWRRAYGDPANPKVMGT